MNKQNATTREVEMAWLWKARKAKNRLPTLPTSHLEIPPKAGGDFHIPTSPATKLMEKCKTKTGFTLSHSSEYPLTPEKRKSRRRASPYAEKKLEM